MLSKNDIENKLHEIKPILAEKFHVSRIGYFGSYVNEQQTNSSDLDLFVEFSQPCGVEFFYVRKVFGRCL